MFKNKKEKDQELVPMEKVNIEPLIFYNNDLIVDNGLTFRVTGDERIEVKNIQTVYDDLIRKYEQDMFDFENQTGPEYSLVTLLKNKTERLLSNDGSYTEIQTVLDVPEEYAYTKQENLINILGLSLEKEVLDAIYTIMNDRVCSLLTELLERSVTVGDIIDIARVKDILKSYLSRHYLINIGDTLSVENSMQYTENVKNMLVTVIAGELYDNCRTIVYSKDNNFYMESMMETAGIIDTVFSEDNSFAQMLSSMGVDDYWIMVQNIIRQGCILLNDLLSIILSKHTYTLIQVNTSYLTK